MISEKYILKKISSHLNNSKNKKQIKGQFLEINQDRMKNLAQEMAAQLWRGVSARIHSMEPEDIIVGDIEETNDGFKIAISFDKEALHRNSMAHDGFNTLEKYEDGIDNIVLLFTRGYKARSRVYGIWDTYKKGKWLHWHEGIDTSRQERDPDPFLQEIVDDFNSKHKKEVHAVLNTNYKK